MWGFEGSRGGEQWHGASGCLAPPLPPPAPTPNDHLDNEDCEKCNGSGYKGRIGLYEVMRVNDAIRELIMSSSNAEDIRSCAYQNGVKSLLVYGMELVKRGITTIQEVERVCLLEDSGND